jgi:hypothetical protein
MNSEKDSNEQPIVGSDMDTTPPNPALPSKASSGWEMPTPVFQQTSGYLPQGYEKRYGQSVQPANEPDTLTPDAVEKQPTGEPVEQAPAVTVEPQPEISDEHTFVEPIATGTPLPKKRSGVVRAFLTIAALLVGFVILVVFVGLIYYLFLAPSDGSSPF